MFKRTKAIAKKEFKQFLRDKRLIFVSLFFPVFLLVIFGYAVNFDVKNIKVAVYDQNKTELSRNYINSLLSSEYFKLIEYISTDNEIKTVLDGKKVQVVINIPTDFLDKVISKREDSKIQILIDGVDGNTANIIKNYVEIATYRFNLKYQLEQYQKAGVNFYLPISLESRFWFNPTLQTTKFLIPGLIAMILIVTAVISVSLSLVREKERGTIEQINVSSLNSIELILGKSFPYVIISLLNAAFILIVGYILFDVVVKGSYVELFFSILIFLIASTSMGIFISVIANSQQVAFTMATFATLLPSVILSGFIFPIESMPKIIQFFTNVTPAKFFITVLRAIILRGVDINVYWLQLVYLILFAIFFLGFAVIIERKTTNN